MVDQASVAPKTDEEWMQYALSLAHHAEEQGEVPVGAVLVQGGVIVGEGWNQPIIASDPTAHAEVVALRNAGQNISNYRLCDTTLYVSLEPCVMCAGAIIHSRVARVVYGAADLKGGAAGSVFNILGTDQLNHQVDVLGGVMAEDAALVLSSFFRKRRAEKKALRVRL